MANLSQIKREQMISFLEELKKQHNDDESIKAFNQIEKELTEKKFGLIWEEHKEKVDELMETQIPVFEEVKEREIIGSEIDDGYNFIIEGDNLHSLKLLEKTHKDKVDIIYIDPPYNTGNKDFMYDDSYVENEDGFRHSKWLSFMFKRLRIARQLLAPTGVIFLSIDDNEQANLKLLCDDIFGENNYVATLPRVTKKSGKDHAEGVAKNNDYVLVYAKERGKAKFKGIIATDDDYPQIDEHYDTRGGYKLNQTLDYDSLWYNPAMDFPIEIDGQKFYPGGDEKLHEARHNGDHKAKDWVWRWSYEKFKFGLDNGFVVIKTGRGRPRIYTKTYANASISNSRPYTIEYKTRETKLSSIALVENKFSNDNAKKEISRIGLDEFSFPKPTSLISQLIEICQKQDLILDFFAGSGTTGHAVLEMNNLDGGNRKFILCTNNESGICENITYQRIKTVITGKKKDGSDYSEGVAANLKYYKTDAINKDNDEIREELLKHIVEMIQLQYGVKVDGKKFVIIMSDDEMDKFEKKYSSYSNLEALFINQDVLLSTSQEKLLSGLKVFFVPDCYYDFELREVGELW